MSLKFFLFQKVSVFINYQLTYEFFTFFIQSTLALKIRVKLEALKQKLKPY
jgi:hypothetical protein